MKYVQQTRSQDKDFWTAGRGLLFTTTAGSLPRIHSALPNRLGRGGGRRYTPHAGRLRRCPPGGGMYPATHGIRRPGFYPSVEWRVSPGDPCRPLTS